jgi:DNA polymerase-1
MKNVMLLDFSNLFFRAYHAAPSLSFDGKETGAILLFYKMIKRIQIINDCNILFVLDGGSEDRKKIDENYKANRNFERSETFESQKKDILYMLKIGNAAIWKINNYEADDLIASYAKNNDCSIFSNDKDMLSLLRNGVTIFRYEKKGEIVEVTSSKFTEEYSFNPCDWIIYKALVGDRSDNIRGIDGFGPVYAQKAIKNYGSDIEKMKKSGYGKCFDNLRKDWNTFMKNIKIISFKDDAFFDDDVTEIDWSTINTYLKTLGFSIHHLK